MAVLLSHPDQSLLQHIQGVYQMAKASWEDKDVLYWDKEALARAVAVAAFFHDFGKSTTYFQDYITQKEKSKKPENSHTMLSSIVSYYVALSVLPADDEEERQLAALMVLMAVRRHHGNIHHFKAEFDYFLDEQELMLKQAKAVDYAAWQEILLSLEEDFPFSLKNLLPFDEERVVGWVNQFYSELPKLRRWLRKRYGLLQGNLQLKDYNKFLILYSLLLDGDKNQAALRESFYRGRQNIPEDLVQRFKEGLAWQDTPMNRLREQAFQEVDDRLRSAEGPIFSITLPTGMGKTLVALNAALRLREKRRLEQGVAPRIIYTLPFLSVIDQNHDVFEKVLQVTGKEVDFTLLVKHHSLVDPYEQISQRASGLESEYDFDQAQIILEGWNSEIICTTFVQLFHTLLTNRNRSLRKFHRLAGAILVLDEVQAIPVKYWDLMREMLLELASGLKTDIILLTATQPHIFLPEDGLQSLCRPEVYFSQMRRLTIFPLLEEKMNIQEFVRSLEIKPEKRYLFIMNTIESAKQLHRQLTEMTGEEVGFLSTHVVPKERLKRIEAIRDGKFRLVVSTQLVEAGVDIDFDVVYRDLAPLDAICQAAGRCNRHHKRAGEMYIVELRQEEKNVSMAQVIYGKVPLEITRNILKEYNQIEEPMLLELVDRYFTLVREKTRNESAAYLQSVKTLYFTGEKGETRIPICDFQLIEEEYKKMDVFVEVDEQAEDIWRQYVQISQIEDALERYRQFARLKKSFHEYVISVPTHVDNKPPLVDGMPYVNRFSLKEYYDSATGFITKGTVAIW